MNIQTQYIHSKLRYIYVDTCSHTQTAKQLKEANTEGDEKLIHTSIRCPKDECVINLENISAVDYVYAYLLSTLNIKTQW